GVVHQRAAAVEDAEARVRADRADLVAPAVARRAGHVDVAAARDALLLSGPSRRRQPGEADVVVVAAGQAQLQLARLRLWRHDFDNRVVDGHRRRPQLAVALVVGAGEFTDQLG